MNRTIEDLRDDLKKATLKEITDGIKQINIAIDGHVGTTGRKDDIIVKFAHFIQGLVKAQKEIAINVVIRIMKDTTNGKVSWKYEDNQIYLKSVQVLPDTTINENLTFKPSPFFLPVAKLCSVKICPASSNIRQTKRFQFTLDENSRSLLTTSSTVDDRSPYQVRFYCARYDGVYSDLSVEFPAICELKVNNTALPVSILRCLKGKPGTVNPPDITILTHKKELNTIDLVYINNNVSFIATAYLVKRTTVSELIYKMKQNNILTKEEVIEKLQQMQEEDEIIMESETLSTKDPLVFTRIITPIRSKSCSHLQCFDATIYLTMNEQTPTWSCPVCYKRIDSWKDLYIDEYFKEMLANTPKHIKSVLVEPSGNITIVDENPDLAIEDEEEDEFEEESNKPKEKEVITILLDDDDDDDEVVVSSSKRGASTNSVEEQTATDVEIVHTNIPTNETLKRKNSTESESDANKRPKLNVIDLTFDSDEDDQASNESQENSTISTEASENDKVNDNALFSLIPEKTPFTENNQQSINIYKFT